jgi:glycosyl transferase family 1
MAEILAAVTASVAAAAARDSSGSVRAVEVFNHHGYLSDVADDRTVFVLVPHEYFAVAPAEPQLLYDRSIGFGVEHPGTATFETSVHHSQRLGGRFEISEQSIAELAGRGVTAYHFPLGYVPDWDLWGGRRAERPIDVAYLGTADQRRLAILARNATELAGMRTELLIPPHEPMTRPRPDFLQNEAKWRLLSQSSLLLNLHREGKTAFEWVRGLEAMINGCVVITEPSSDLGPLCPGEHLLVAEPDRIGSVIRAALSDLDNLDRIAHTAYEFCRRELSMAEPARRLARTAEQLHQQHPVAPGRTFTATPQPSALMSDDQPMAEWMPTPLSFPSAPGAPADTWLAASLGELAEHRARNVRFSVTRTANAPAAPAGVEVLCVQQPGDGPWWLTAESIGNDGPQATLALALPGRDFLPPAQPVHAGPAVVVSSDLAIGRGRARNALLEATRAEYVAVVDSGDEFRTDALAAMVEVLCSEPAIDVAFCMATLGRHSLVNMLVPETRRLRRFPYLTRGYVVRRTLLDELGGFSEDPYLDDYVDHLFWTQVAQRHTGVRLLRRIGLSLWERTPQRSLASVDEPSVIERLRRAAAMVD